MNTEPEVTGMKDMTLQQLEERNDVLEGEMAAIKAKLDHVRARRRETGEWADPDWYRRAVTRQRFLGVEHQRLSREIARRKREAKAACAANLERAFMSSAKAILPVEQFEQVLRTAKGITGHG